MPADPFAAWLLEIDRQGLICAVCFTAMIVFSWGLAYAVVRGIRW